MHGAAGRCYATPGAPDATQKIMQSSLTPLVLAAARQLIVRSVVAFYRIGVVAGRRDSLVNLIHTGLCRVEHDTELVCVHVPVCALHTGHAFGGRLNCFFAHATVAPHLELGSLCACGSRRGLFYRHGSGDWLLGVCVESAESRYADEKQNFHVFEIESVK